MPEQIPVASFLEHTWEDYKSPTTSQFDKKMLQCRHTVATIEEELDTDRSELTKLKKSVRALYNATNKHAQNEKDIGENLERMSNSTSNNHKGINAGLYEFAKLTKVIASLIEDLSKSLHNSLQFPLESFLKGDIRGVKGDLRKPFDKAWKDYDTKFSKLEKEKKKMANEAGFYKTGLSGEEVAEEMEKERKIFQLQMCSYLIKVNEIKTKKGVDLLQYLIEYYKAIKTFFEAGQRAIDQQQAFVDNLGESLKEIKQTQHEEKQKLQQLKTSLQNSMSGYKEPSSVSATPPGYSLHQMQGNKNHGSEKEGYLLKKSEGMLKKVWQKRKCRIEEGIMFISHSVETKEPVRLNLLTCQVKLVPDDPGKKCFDVVTSHGNRTYHFQADDEKEMEKWISVLSNAKEAVLLKAFQETGSSPAMNQSVRELTHSIIERIKALPGNSVCCDCGAADPEWLSTNLGVLICLECCGIHRNLGVHVSRTQSIVIDQLGTSQLLLARVIGNDDFNEVLEARLGDSAQKLKPNSPMLEREEFIKAKYVQHKFTYQTCSDTQELLQDLQQSIQTHEIQALLQVYAEGLDLMTPLPESATGETALHLAISLEDGSSLPLVDFIIQNSSLNRLGRQTKDGDTALHFCAQMNKTECMKCLLRTKPDIASVKNNAGKTPLDVAMDNGHQLCAELVKAAIAGKSDVFEHLNIEWDLIYDDHGLDQVDYSDDELECTPDRKPRSRPSSLIGVSFEGASRDGSPRERIDSESSNRLSQLPAKPRKHHHLTHPTRFRNSINHRNIPGIGVNMPNSVSSQSAPNSAAILSSQPPDQKSPDNPPLPPRGVKMPPPPKPPGGIVIGEHVRNVSEPSMDRSYMQHRRTPSEPPPRPLPLDAGSRKTTAIPASRPGTSLPNETGDKPDIPPRPRTLSSNDDSRQRNSDGDIPPPVPAPRKPKKIGFRRSQALFDCDADNEDELSFREGEIILLVREEEEEWWEGEIEGEPHRKGLFPISFVKPLPD